MSGYVENDDYARFAARVVRGLAQRAANDPTALAHLAEIAEITHAGIRQAAKAAHAEGYSWSEIAGILGITKQAAHQRFSRQGGLDDFRGEGRAS